MSSTANSEFWNDLSAGLSLGFEGYTLNVGKEGKSDNGDDNASAPAASVPATTTDAPTAMEWVKKNPLAVGVGVVAVLALAALSMGKR
jgi:hypothetical protein